MIEAYSINGWVDIYEKEKGIKLNANTLRKRRMVCGLGMLVPPKTYMLTREQFMQVLETPLPFCNAVVKNV